MQVEWTCRWSGCEWMCEWIGVGSKEKLLSGVVVGGSGRTLAKALVCF